MTDQTKAYLTTDELSKRWGVPVTTLNHWRNRKQGPAYIKLESTVRYQLADIEAYESRQRVEVA